MASKVHWVAFKPEWYRYFKRKTGNAFTWANVNSNCAAVASLYCKYLKKGETQYGFFTGEVTHAYWVELDNEHHWFRHGWIKIKNAIMDPTRWCFYKEEAPRLCMTDTRNDEYDLGMNAAKEALFSAYRKHIPEFKPQQAVSCDQPDLLWKFGGQVDIGRLFWIANRAPHTDAFVDEEERVRIFKWLEEREYVSFIPIDNRLSRGVKKSLLDL